MCNLHRRNHVLAQSWYQLHEFAMEREGVVQPVVHATVESMSFRY
jgi:hypothetical protein